MIRRPRRLVLVGGALADVVLTVPNLPRRGGAVLARATEFRPAQQLEVLLVARTLGLQAALAGRVGTGPVARYVRRQIEAAGVEVLLPPGENDQGFSVTFVESGGPSAAVISPGAEVRLSAGDLAAVRLDAQDAAYLWGIDLLDEVSGPAVATWCADAAGLGEAQLVLDPGPLVADIPDGVLDAVLARTDVLLLGEHELTLMAGLGDTGRRTRAVADVLDLLRPHAALLVRDGDGDGGCVLHRSDHEPVGYPRQDAGWDDFDDANDPAWVVLARLANVVPRDPDIVATTPVAVAPRE